MHICSRSTQPSCWVIRSLYESLCVWLSKNKNIVAMYWSEVWVLFLCMHTWQTMHCNAMQIAMQCNVLWCSVVQYRDFKICAIRLELVIRSLAEIFIGTGYWEKCRIGAAQNCLDLVLCLYRRHHGTRGPWRQVETQLDQTWCRKYQVNNGNKICIRIAIRLEIRLVFTLILQ